MKQEDAVNIKLTGDLAQSTLFSGKTQSLRAIIQSGDLSFLMEAHDALSAMIAERSGFAGIWASGLSIATALGLRDANEASWSQVVDVIERMSDATTIPILVDGDSGFGNFNNARLVARKLCERGAAEVVSKVLESAVANAVNNEQLDPDELYVAECFADEGPVLKRWRPRARGRATRIQKQTCHITVIVAQLSPEELEMREARLAASGAQTAAAARAARVAASRAAAKDDDETDAEAGDDGNEESGDDPEAAAEVAESSTEAEAEPTAEASATSATSAASGEDGDDGESEGGEKPGGSQEGSN